MLDAGARRRALGVVLTGLTGLLIALIIATIFGALVIAINGKLP